MTVVLHLSDTHFGTEQPAVVEALVELANLERPDLVVLSGDITQRARIGQFAAARAFMDRIKSPSLAIPGNHDIPLFDVWTRVTAPYSHHCAFFGQELEPSHECEALLVVGVNTTRRYRHKHGEISIGQIDRVVRRLEQAREAQLRVIVVHQPVAVTRREDRNNLVRGFNRARSRWALAGADLVMGGHIHLPYVRVIDDGPRPIWAVQAGTAVSSRIRDGKPNSVNLVRWDSTAHRRECAVEQWDFDVDDQAFRRVLITRLSPARE